MKIATSLTRLFSWVGALTLVSVQVFAKDNYKEFRRDQWDLDLGMNYFFSNANHIELGGGRRGLDSGHEYSLLDMTLSTRYMGRKNTAFFAWGSVGNAESKDESFVRTNSALSDAGLGFEFKMYSGFVDLIPTLAFKAPLQNLDTQSDLVANNEGAIEFHTHLTVQKDLGAWLGYTWLGFNYRGEGRSYLMPWGVGAQYQTLRFNWGAELFGYNSITDDTNDNILRDNYINNVQAGSLKFYSRNPALIESQFYGLYKLSKSWSLQSHAGATIAGKNTAAGFNVGGFIRYTFDMTDGYRQAPEVVPYIDSPVPRAKSQMYGDSISSEREVKKFKESTKDGVDQNLFQPRPTRRPRPRQLQKELDNTEFQIELRRKKKGE